MDHLQLSNWVIERGAPGAHTSPENWPKQRTKGVYSQIGVDETRWLMSALPESGLQDSRGMSAKGQQETHAPQQYSLEAENSLAAVSPKSDQVF